MLNRICKTNCQLSISSHFYIFYCARYLTDSTTLTITYMAVSMVINILTTGPAVSLLVLNVLLVFLITSLSYAAGTVRPSTNRSEQSATHQKAAQSNGCCEYIRGHFSEVHTRSSSARQACHSHSL